MRKSLKGWLIAVILFFVIFGFVYSNFAKNEQGAVTQGELAQMLGEKMDLEVPAGSGANGYIRALERRGIKPAGGWNSGKPVTTNDLGNIFVGAGRLQAEVDAGKDPRTVLKEVGVVLPGEINKTTLNNVLEEPSVKRLLEAPLMAGPSVPYPTQDTSMEEEQIKPKSPTPVQTPPAPAMKEEVKPSSGGGT